MTAEPLTPVHPLEAWRSTFAALSRELGSVPSLHPREGSPRAGRASGGTPRAGRPAVDLRPDAAAVDLRVPPLTAARSAVADALGSPLPSTVGTWTDLGGGARAFCLGPDEWLVTDPHRAGPAWERALIDALRPHGGAAVDVTAQRTGLRLGGGAARELLAFGCSLDLRPAAFGPGSCAQTVVWGAPVLMAADDDGIDLLVRSSFAGHLAARLVDAAQELRPDPAPPLHPR